MDGTDGRYDALSRLGVRRAGAWTALARATLTMSSTLQPRARSFIGAASPCRMGPMAAARQPFGDLVRDVGGVEVGKTNTFARPAAGEPGALRVATASASA